MRPSRFLALLGLALLAGCGPTTVTSTAPSTGKTDVPIHNDTPLSELGPMFDGAPAPQSLPVYSSFDALPPKYDIVSLQSPIRNQKHRGTCTIFATLGLMEQLYIKEGTYRDPDFSEEYLQWAVKNQYGAYAGSEGSSPQANLAAIHQYGIVTEDLDPYQPNAWNETNDPACVSEDGELKSGLPTRCYTNGDPTPEALAGPKFKLPSGQWVSTNTTSLKSYIKANDQDVVVGLTFFYQAWNHRLSDLPINSDYWRMGFVTYPNAEDKTKSFAKPAGHGIVLVGWDDTLEVPMRDATGTIVTDSAGNPQKEKGFFIFKNSWGTGNFGINNPYGDGYGYISYRYVQEYGSAYVSGVPTDVPPPPSTSVTQHADAAPAMAIPDDDPAGINSTLSIPNAGAITDVKLGVDITHTWKGDLVVTLSHAGKTVTVQDRQGGSEDDLKTSFDLTDFSGLDAAGDWTLSVVDTAGYDVGTLNGWTLDVTSSSGS